MKYPEMTWGRMEAIINKLGGMEGVERFLRGELVVKAAELLRLITTAKVGSVKKFIAKDNLKSANIGWTGDNFNRALLSKVEENVPSADLVIQRLEKNSLDAPILAKLGDNAEISLAHFFEMIKNQANGEDGPLLTNGHANIAYIRGTDGNLWAVYADWNSGYCYWHVDAYSVEYPHEWNDGHQVLSRK